MWFAWTQRPARQFGASLRRSVRSGGHVSRSAGHSHAREGRVYFASPTGLIGCLDSDAGQPRWTLNVFEHFAVGPVEFGYSCSPVVVDDKVLLPVGAPKASMVALNADTAAFSGIRAMIRSVMCRTAD